MEDKRFIVAVPKDKYNAAAKLAKANGLSMNAFVRSLVIRATLRPEEFGFVSVPKEDFRKALIPKVA